MKDTAIINTLSPLTYLYKQVFFPPVRITLIQTIQMELILKGYLIQGVSMNSWTNPGWGGWGMLSYLIELLYLETVFGTDRTFVTNMLCQKQTNRLVSFYSVRID